MKYINNHSLTKIVSRISFLGLLPSVFYIICSFNQFPPSSYKKIGIKDSSVLVNHKEPIKESQLNKEYKSYIDSIWKLDQSVRKSIKYGKARKYIIACKKDSTIINETKHLESVQLINQWIKLDSLNSLSFVGKMKKFGYPSIEKVGKKAFNHTWQILVHFGYRDMKNEFLPILDAALNDSILQPSIYAYIKDSYLFRHEKKQVYYQYQCYMYKDLNESEKQEIILNRNSIGLKENEFSHNGFIGTWK